MTRESILLQLATNAYGDPTAATLDPERISTLSTPGVREIPSIGFRAEVYRIEETREVVVAIAGTRPSFASLVNATGLPGVNIPDQQIAAADALVRAVSAEYGPVTLVGHSAGGLTAQLLAADQHLVTEESALPIREAWGFNSPGAAPYVRDIFGQAGQPMPETFSTIYSMGDSRDIVFRLHDARGENALIGNSHIGAIQIANQVHDSDPAYGWALLNPLMAVANANDLAQYHPITALADEYARSLPDSPPLVVAHEFSGPSGLDYLTTVTAGSGTPIDEGAEQFETYQTSSPLVLDLDGDGIETQGLLAGAFFDHAGDGFAELTGWIGGGDGLLILDRNGNGTVDHGGELFGNETILHNGAKAADGYQALADFDQNGDGRVDPGDPLWSQLRVWRDIDGNGDSDASELQVLADLGVSAIGTEATSSTFIDADGNEHRLIGTFLRSDGISGDTADVWFRVARRHALPGEHLPVPDDVAALPNIQGHGTVHDLHQAIVRDTSGGLKLLVQQFIAEPDPADRTALLEQMLVRWSGSDGVDPGSRGPYIDARRLTTLERVYGEAFIGIEGTGNPNAEVGGLLNHTFQGFAELAYAQLMVQSHLMDLWASSIYTWDATAERVRGDLSVVIGELHDLLAADPDAGRVALGEFARSIRGLGVEAMVDYQAFRDAFATLGEDVAWIVDSGGKALLAGTPGDDTLIGVATADALLGGDGNDTLSGDDGDDILYGGAGADALVGGANDDLLDGGTGNDALDGRRGHDRLFGRAGDDTLLGDAGDDVLEGGDGVDSLDGGEGNDILVGGGGPDTLLGREQNDTLFGGDGDDSLAGNRGADTLAGEAGNDVLAGEGGADILDGGAGDDSLDGGTENDAYHFGRGGGRDVIVDRDATPGNRDVIVLGAGIAPTEVHATREGDDLVLEIGGTTDQLRITSWFSVSAPGQYEVEDVRFADGAVWDRAALREAVIVPTEGPDHLTGYEAADVLLGLGGDDILAGGGGDDWLDGGAGNDALTGNQGHDTLFGGAGGDSLRGNEGLDTLWGGEGDDVLAGDRDDDVLAGESGDDALDGGGGIDQLDGGTGNDVLAGGDEADSLNGGAGNDSLRGDDGDDVLRGGIGLDLISGNAGDDTLYGGADDDLLTGDRDDDLLVGEAGNDHLDGGPGIDEMFGGPGDDTYVVDDAADWSGEEAGEGTDTVEAWVNHTLRANVEHLMLLGTGPTAAMGNELNNRLTGNPASNVLAGAAGDDILDGGPGLDWLAGGSGNDTYVLADGGDVVLEHAGEGTDLVRSALTYALPPNVEDLTLTGTTPVIGTGNELNNRLTGNVGGNVLDGGPGADAMAGGFGDDTYVVDAGDAVTESLNEGTDRIETSVTYGLPANVEDLTLTGTSAVDGTGNALNNRLTGNAGANTLTGDAGDDVLDGGAGDDVLDGGAGIDLLGGGPGNDAYVIAEAGDAVSERAGEGIDLVQSALTYTLPANVEDLALTTAAPLNGTGNALNNRLTGNPGANILTGAAGDDVLDGGGGADRLAGGTGNDTYIVADATDVVIENSNQGADTIESAVTYTLPGHVERLTLTGAGAIDGTGNALGNILTGNGAANRLNGGAGIDAMAGAGGDDTYVVDHVAEVVTERAGEGTDTIETDVTYALPANVERLTLTGSGSINATGNALNNPLTGNSKSNVLDGRAGADAMAGGGGNDTYVIDDVADTVIEAPNAGTDTVKSAVAYGLPDNVEKLSLTGAAAISGIGNALNNTLTGNGGANLLDGGPGADTMAGGAGNDTYIVDRPTDTVQEAANAGIDTILSATTYTLPVNVENATLTGADAIGVTGNTLANVLQGNRGANLLDGRAGNDTYLFNRGGGRDEIQDIDATAGNTDTLAFASDIAAIDLIISRQANNLRIAIHGSNDRIDIPTWYVAPANQIEIFRADDGRQLLSTQVDQLIQAMAGYSAQTGLSWDQAVDQRPQEVEAILAAHWQPAGS